MRALLLVFITIGWVGNAGSAEAGFITASASADAYADTLDAIVDSPLIDADELKVSVGKASGTQIRSALEFDLSSIPDEMLVESAVLSLSTKYMFPGFSGSQFEARFLGYTGNGQIENADILNPDASVLGSFAVSESEQAVSLDVTSFVSPLHDMNSSFVGFRLDPITLAFASQLLFHSSEVSDAGLRPGLTILASPRPSVVPEPSSIVLLGLGTLSLIGCGLYSRKKAGQGPPSVFPRADPS